MTTLKNSNEQKPQLAVTLKRGKLKVYAEYRAEYRGRSLRMRVPLSETLMGTSKYVPHAGAKEIAKAARRFWRMEKAQRDTLDLDVRNPHIPSDKCGFDRNASITAGTYCCTCGWEDFDEVTAREGMAELESFCPPDLFDKRGEIK